MDILCNVRGNVDILYNVRGSVDILLQEDWQQCDRLERVMRRS